MYMDKQRLDSGLGLVACFCFLGLSNGVSSYGYTVVQMILGILNGTRIEECMRHEYVMVLTLQVLVPFFVMLDL